METRKSFEEQVFVAIVHDVLKLCTDVSPRALRLTAHKIEQRIAREGISFLTKTLPRLGKALDRALLGATLNCEGFRKIPNTQLPRFLGELFQRVLAPDGRVLPAPCIKSIASLRSILYCFYKYEIPYSKEQEQKVLDSFKQTDVDLAKYNKRCDRQCGGGLYKPWHLHDNQKRARVCGCDFGFCSREHSKLDIPRVIYRAQQLLERLFQSFDWTDIYPRHGPGAVSTGERGLFKYVWSRVSSRITDKYPLDAYFYVSLSDVVDNLDSIRAIKDDENSAKIVLVPKDSRGPRLISEESNDFQWIQQGLREALYRHVESHELTKYAIHFTDQTPNQRGALLGSLDVHRYINDAGLLKASKLLNGLYATLDLKEASDRVSVGLVTLLFPEHIVDVLMSARSLGTRLPNGQYLKLNKYAPMGSALCFPVMALTIWAILSGGGLDEDHNGEILVYGDDIVVPTAQAEYATELLEAFGLLVNRNKSCSQGFFRESCGVDAYRGHIVTPFRIRKVWTSSRCPDTLASWCEYENTLFKRGLTGASILIAEKLQAIYAGLIPHVSENLRVPSLASVTDSSHRRRFNPLTQCWERRVWTLVPRKSRQDVPGWKLLLHWFAQKGRPSSTVYRSDEHSDRSYCTLQEYARKCACSEGEQVGIYTKRRSNRIVQRWIPEREPLKYDPLSHWWPRNMAPETTFGDE